jgi:hypothetical protein
LFEAGEGLETAVIRHRFNGLGSLVGAGGSLGEVEAPEGCVEGGEGFKTGSGVSETGKNGGLFRVGRRIGLGVGAALCLAGEVVPGKEVNLGVEAVGTRVGRGAALAVCGDGAAREAAVAASGFALGVGDGSLKQAGGSGHDRNLLGRR